MDRDLETDFDTLGEPALRAIVHDFIGRCFGDAMIGFLFMRASRERIEEFEYQHAADHLGGDVTYAGRPLAAAHGPHRILGGQFDRRRTLLKQTLDDHGVPPGIRDRWLAFQDGLRDQITGNASGQCIA